MMLKRFPKLGDTGEPSNPAIQLYGRRFYKDQTHIEYLAEFLLAFSSPKGKSKNGEFSFAVEESSSHAVYWPHDQLALKFFTCFPTSKLDTRHQVHQQAYCDALEDLRKCIVGVKEDKDETVRLLQSFFGGYVGVANNRTWVTHSFLPVAPELLAREVTWNHPSALTNSRNVDTTTWEGLSTYFDNSTHNFLGRGGGCFSYSWHIYSRRAIALATLEFLKIAVTSIFNFSL